MQKSTGAFGKTAPARRSSGARKVKKFVRKRANEGIAGVVLAEGKKFVKPPFSHPAERTTGERNRMREKRGSHRARFYRSTKIRLSLILPLRESCWGVPSPNPAMRLVPLENPTKKYLKNRPQNGGK